MWLYEARDTDGDVESPLLPVIQPHHTVPEPPALGRRGAGHTRAGHQAQTGQASLQLSPYAH